MKKLNLDFARISALAVVALSTQVAEAAKLKNICAMHTGMTTDRYIGVYETGQGKPDGCHEFKPSKGQYAKDTDKFGNTYVYSTPFVFSSSHVGENKAYSGSQYAAIKSCLQDCVSATQTSTSSLSDLKKMDSTFSSTAGGTSKPTDQIMAELQANLHDNKRQFETPMSDTPKPEHLNTKSGGKIEVTAEMKEAMQKRLNKSGGGVINGDGTVTKIEEDDDGNLYYKVGGKKYSPDGNEISPPHDVFKIGNKEYKDRSTFVDALGKGNGEIHYADGSTAYYENGAPVKTVDKNGKVIAQKGKKKPGEKDVPLDDCQVSVSIDPNYSCNMTNKIAHFSKVGNEVMQTAGALVVGTIGNQTAQNAQNGTASSAQKGVAKMAKTSFAYEAILGAANIATAASLGDKMLKHKKASQELKMKADEASADANNPDAARYKQAAFEQADAKKTAEEGAFAATMYAVKNATAAAAAKKLQKDAEKAARQYKELETMTATQGVAWEQAQAVVGLGPDATQSAATEGTETTSSQDGAGGGGEPGTNLLGNGTDLNGDKSGPEALAPGAFKQAAGGTGGGGSGGGGAGAGGGGGGASPSEESKAAYASEFGTKEKYESGGGIGGAKPAGGAGAKDGGGIDLNNLLAQFLPKSEEDVGSKNGILDYAGGGKRGIASDEAPSYLDKNADLFQRIHETMSEKNRKGHVGI